MTKRMAYGTALLACLLLWGCGGGDGGVSQTTHDQTLQELEALQAEVRAQEEAREAEERRQAAEEAARLAAQAAEEEAAEQQSQVDALAATIAALTTALAEREAAAEPEPEPVVEAEEEEEEEEAVVTATATPPVTPPPPPQPTTPAEQTAKATQLAEHLMEAFGALADPFALKASPVKSEVLTPGNQRLLRSGYSPGSGNAATMSLTSGNKTGKTIVRSSRMTSMTVMEYFASQRDPMDMTRLRLVDAASDAPTGVALQNGTIPHFTTTPPVTTKWRLPRPGGLSANVADTDNNPDTALDPGTSVADNTVRAVSYTGYIYGQSGRFVCAPAAGSTCQVQITPAYVPNTVNNRYDLANLIVQSVAPQNDGTFAAGGTLYFKPNSGTRYQLYEGGPVGADAEYMLYGYWYQEPSIPAGEYTFDWFAQAFGRAVTWPTGVTGTVYYDGTAVGMYVEKDPNYAVDAHRHGEFVADVILKATSVADADVTGTVDDFRTTPIGGSTAPVTSDRWVVQLQADGAVNIKDMLGTQAGKWDFEFVPAHVNAAADKPLPAVVGGFDARIVDSDDDSADQIDYSLAIVGAFGAQSR